MTPEERQVLASLKLQKKANAVYAKCLEYRDRALAEYYEVKENLDIYEDMDPGDAKVTLEGNDWNVLTVLNLLELLGVPSCETS